MASTSITMPTSPASTATKEVFKERSGLCRSHSGINLCKKAGIRRSYSDNHLCYFVNRIRCESSKPNLKNNRSAGIFLLQISSSIIPDSLKSFLYDPEMNKDSSIADKDVNFDENPMENDEEEKEIKEQTGWIDEVGCVANYDSEGEGSKEIYDRESFSKLLVQVPWSDTKLFSQLAFLCNMAYVIPELKGKDLKRYYGLEFVTSSVEKKAEVAAIKVKLDQDLTRVPVTATAASESNFQKPVDSEQKRSSRSSIAYEIAASVASYVQSRTKNLLAPSSKSHHEGHNVGLGKDGDQPEKEEENLPRVYESEVAAYMAASTMTAVVAAGEKEKQEAARDLQSVHSSPCEWFICDDSSTYTRCFVIQGSDSLASWLANLFFEPTKFEDTDVFVHRGIYEAAKGIYQQFLPEIMDHAKKHGDRAKFQFIGHSLGGSLSLLVNLMLLTRRVVKPSAMRLVVTFGSPFVFCEGQKILKLLGLDESHVHCVTMHRDIVPRAFSCKYPNHVSLFLKQVSRTSSITVVLESARAEAALNLFLYMLASHVLGAIWYLLSVETQVRCWRNVARKHRLDRRLLYCNDDKDPRRTDNSSNPDLLPLLNTYCPLINPDDTNSTVFNFGIFIDALQSGIVETRDFRKKLFYCFWWGLRNLSSVGQNLKTSTFVGEIIFAVVISIAGLVLFALLIGNMQKYLQSITAVKVEEMRIKRADAERWMKHRKLPGNLKERIRRYQQRKWQETRGVDEESLISCLPRVLRQDIKRHLCLDLLMKVPMFEKMDEQLLDAMCDRLKPVLYTEKSYIEREGDPVEEMLFINRGNLVSTTTNGGITGFFNAVNLKAGDFCGEALLTWALDPQSYSHLPISTRTVQALSEVEAFALLADDLKFLASQHRRLHSKQLQRIFRFYSVQWKTWAASFIQAAWRRYCRRKFLKLLRDEEARLQNALADDSGVSVGASIYVSRFAANALRNLRQDEAPTSGMPERLPLLPQKPAEPDFGA
ncbi:hypothetical protein SLEP1_g9890 [Rubroshorea leprosula]|uniref:Cyclic nucleotide-binding domain-containing protein n=1 Tax=Rubroshorea leprosula TaxID=152421 RepID=A0AAV5I6C1_9ROSI|nr:hypothetical protein SLEP1_g9890 [Rubroshorea leprosula]